MAFYESPRFPTYIAQGAEGGPTFLTEIVELVSGRESRNVTWSEARHRYTVDLLNRTAAELAEVKAFFLDVRGQGHGFRFRDFSDFRVEQTNGILGGGAGSGVAAYQLAKRYQNGARAYDRRIRKPVSGSVSIFRNGSPVTFGTGAGQVALDTTTGIVTFEPDASQSVTAVSAGASTTVTLNAALAPLAIGEKLYLEGLGGTIGAALNGLAHTISNISGAQYTLSTATTGLSWTSGGTGRAFPQAAETLAWSGQFDVPVRFATDEFNPGFRGSNGARGTWGQIQLVEILD